MQVYLHRKYPRVLFCTRLPLARQAAKLIDGLVRCGWCLNALVTLTLLPVHVDTHCPLAQSELKVRDIFALEPYSILYHWT